MIVHRIQYKELSASENLSFRFIIHYKKARVNTSYIVYYYKQYINYRNQKESIRKYNKKKNCGKCCGGKWDPLNFEGTDES